MGNTTSSPAGASGVHGYEDWNDQLKRDDSVDHAYASVLASSTAAAAAAALAAETAVATSGLTSNYIASRNQQKQQQQQQQQQQQKLQQQAYAYQQQQHQQQQQQQQYHHMYGQQAHMMHHGHALPPAAAFSQQQQQLQLVVNGTGAEVRRGQGQLQQQQQQQQALNGNQMTDGSSPTTVHPTRSRSLDGRSSEKRPSIRRRRRLPGVVGPDGELEELEKENEALLERLTGLREGKVQFSAKDKKKIDKQYDEYRGLWKKRKMMTMEIVDALVDAMETVKKKDFIEDVGIETDEMVGADIKVNPLAGL
ncbi:hypothetical protein GQ42DRAFT_157890 [Ramicandelaber brevisporus]|nr:hypothetical protein GQ42DRAFT_157890 [Ramicandelaber brevisporus]